MTRFMVQLNLPLKLRTCCSPTPPHGVPRRLPPTYAFGLFEMPVSYAFELFPQNTATWTRPNASRRCRNRRRPILQCSKPRWLRHPAARIHLPPPVGCSLKSPLQPLHPTTSTRSPQTPRTCSVSPAHFPIRHARCCTVIRCCESGRRGRGGCQAELAVFVRG